MNHSVLHTPGSSPTLPTGRLIFGVDATASREHAWSIARDVQAKMFIEAGLIGTLNLQLVFYGGSMCRASRWASRGEDLARWMGAIQCEAGPTQIGKVLRHALREHEKAPVQGVTFIGDAMEENLDVLAGLANEMGAARLPLHLYQEGNDAASPQCAFQPAGAEDRRHLFDIQSGRAGNHCTSIGPVKRGRARCCR